MSRCSCRNINASDRTNKGRFPVNVTFTAAILGDATTKAFTFDRFWSVLPGVRVLATVLSLLCSSAAGARSVPTSATLAYRASHDRVSAPKSRPRHIRTFDVRADRVGDTPYSSTYYKITNVTAEVGGVTGTAYAVNDDGRIAYSDTGPGGDEAYIVNNGGTFGKLVPPSGVGWTTLDAYALNENAEVVGAFSNQAGSGNIAWTLAGARGSAVAYWGTSGIFGADSSVNDHDLAVGYAANTKYGDAAAFTEHAKPPGEVVGLQGPRGSNCDGAEAEAINDAGEIVGWSCDLTDQIAVRFSLAGYAQPLPIAPKSSYSVAYAVNQRGDVVGQAGFAPTGGAFLLRGGTTIRLPRPKGYQKYSSFTAYAVNASDEVVGDVCAGNCAGFLFVNGRSYDLNTLIPPASGWQIVDALGINDHGEIVGDGYYNGTLYGISLKPPV